MRIRAYTLDVHAGHAPCWMYDTKAGHEVLSLANCKPPIRRVAVGREWIAGVTPKKMGCRLAYLMQVDESISRQEYWERYKRTRFDSIYRPDGEGNWRRLVNPWHTDEESYHSDLSCENVLLSRKFFIFAQSYTAGCKEERGLALNRKYPELARKGMRGSGHLIELPDSFLRWVNNQPRLTLGEFNIIKDFGGCGCWDSLTSDATCSC